MQSLQPHIRKNLLKVCRRAHTKARAVEYLGSSCYRCRGEGLPPTFDICGLPRPMNHYEKWDSTLETQLNHSALLCANCHIIREQGKVRSKHYNKAKAILILGGGCHICHSNDYRSIQFHHLDGKIERLANLYTTWADMRDELFKTVPLCAICHRLYHFRLEILKRDTLLNDLILSFSDIPATIAYTRTLWDYILEMSSLDKNFEAYTKVDYDTPKLENAPPP